MSESGPDASDSNDIEDGVRGKTPETNGAARLTVEELYEREREVVRERRAAAGLTGEGWESVEPFGLGGAAGNLVGLALSGGGLRSALFQRGLLEALSDRGLLKYVDVCASVSGGGFTAGYLAALGERAKAAKSTNFHTDDDFYRFGKGAGGRTVPPAKHDPAPPKGRPPEPGDPGPADRDRFAHAGGYVRDVPGLVGRWLLGTLPVFLLFLSGLAAASAAASLAWRGTDSRWFRDRAGIMGLGDFGSDLGFAFLPVIPVLLGWFAVQFAAGRRTQFSAGAWLTLFPWAAGTLLAVPLLRADGATVGAAWVWAAPVALAVPLLARLRGVARPHFKRTAEWAWWGAAAAGVLGLTWLAAESLGLSWAAFDRLPPAAAWLGPTWAPWVPSGPAAVAVAVTLVLCQALPAGAFAKLFPTGPTDPAEAGEPPVRVRRTARLATLCVLAAVVVSVAAFLGNGINSVGRASTADSALHWESWAGWLGVAAGVMQLITVLGFDGVFRSQTPNASPLQRTAFRFVLTGVIGLPAFAVLHYFASEDVSGHTDERVADLLHGDLKNRAAFASVLDELVLATREGAGGKVLGPGARPFRRVGSVDDDRGRRAEAPLEVKRATEAVDDLRDRLRGPDGRERRLTDPTTWLDRFLAVYLDSDEMDDECAADGSKGGWRRHAELVAERNAAWTRALDRFNGDDGLGSVALTRHLLRLVEAKAEAQKLSDRVEEGETRRGRSGATLTDVMVGPVGAWGQLTAPAGPPFTDTQRRRLAERWIKEAAGEIGGRDGTWLRDLWRRATHHGLDDRPPRRSAATGDDPGDHLDREPLAGDEVKRLNHLLLAALFPTAVRPPNDASTWLVFLPDQKVRFGALLIAGGAFLFLLFGWVDFNRHSPSLQFYRDALRRHFLGPAALPKLRGKAGDFQPDPPLKDLAPWEAGLPFPLFVATAAVRRSRVRFDPIGPGGGGSEGTNSGEAAVHTLERPVTEHLPFIFSPKACGGAALGVQPTAAYAGGGLRVSDAITASGSAVSPYLTDNPWLTWAMTGLNLRLGVWLPRPEPEARPDRRPGAVLIAGAVMHAALTVAALTAGAAGTVALVRLGGVFGLSGGVAAAVLLTVAVVAALAAAANAAAAVLRFRESNEGERGESAPATAGGHGAGVRRLVRAAFAAPGAFWRLCRGRTEPPARLPAAGAWPVLREWAKSFTRAEVRDFRLAFVADGGFRDNLGVEQLLKRRCRLIVVSDAGYNHGRSEFTALANLVTLARTELGCELFDLDADGPLDLDRFLKTAPVGPDGKPAGPRLAPQQVLALRVRYADGTGGLLLYCQMALTGREDADLRQAREQFPHFPDEPTGNQVYSDRQTELYRRLGAHVGRVLCRNLPPARDGGERGRVLRFEDLCERLTLATVQECAAEGGVADGEASAGRVLGAGADRRVAAGLQDRKAAHFFPKRDALARRLGLNHDPFAEACRLPGRDREYAAAAREVDLWLRLYRDDADFRLYHDARVWRRLRGDGGLDAWEPAYGAAGGGFDPGLLGRVLCPGHVAVAYMACARRADLDPPAEHVDLPGSDADRHQRGRDWQPFAAGGRDRLAELVVEFFRQPEPSNPHAASALRYGLTPLRLQECGGPVGLSNAVISGLGDLDGEPPRDAPPGTNSHHGRFDSGDASEKPLPGTRTDFPTPLGVAPIHRFLIAVSESVAPERGAVQICQDLNAWLYRERPPRSRVVLGEKAAAELWPAPAHSA